MRCSGNASGRSWTRNLFLAVMFYVGLCEMLTTTPSISWDGVPYLLGMAVLPVGFFGIVFLFAYPGHLLIALLLLWYVWFWRRWPLRQALAISLPFWVVAYRFTPKLW